MNKRGRRLRNKAGAIITAFIFACASTPLLNHSAIADTTTNNVNAVANIAPKCSFTQINPLDFGEYGNQNNNLDVLTTFQLKCTKNTTASIGMNNGLYSSSASGTTRAMKAAITNNYINYEIYTNSARTNVWNNSTNKVSYTATSSAPATFTVYGRIPTQPNVPHGSYFDTITITATF